MINIYTKQIKHNIEKVDKVEIFYSIDTNYKNRLDDFNQFIDHNVLEHVSDIDTLLKHIQSELNNCNANGLVRIFYKSRKQRMVGTLGKQPSTHILRGNESILLYLNIKQR